MPSMEQIQLTRTYRITSFLDKEAALSLYGMGIQPGQNLTVLRKSPFGKSYIVAVGSRRLAMRYRELSSIRLEPLNGKSE